MGIESYNLTIIPKNIDSIIENNRIKYRGHTTFSIEDINHLVINSFNNTPIDCNSFNINDEVKITILTENNYYQGTILEASLSWFEESLVTVFEIIKCFNKAINDHRIYNSLGLDFHLTTFKDFELFVKKCNYDKINNFKQYYTNCHFKSLPGDDFYNKRRLNALLINKVFKKLKKRIMAFFKNYN